MKIIVPLAPGFEEIEAVSIIDVLRRASIDVTVVTLGPNPVTGSHGIAVRADKSIDEVKAADFQCIVLPGGMPGSANLKKSERILSIIRDIDGNGGYVAAICAAPIVLAAAGILSGKTVTSFPGYEQELKGAAWTGEPVTMDGRIITGKGPGCAIPFALKLVEVIKGAPAADELKRALQVYWM